jgi:hypothetical protein
MRRRIGIAAGVLAAASAILWGVLAVARVRMDPGSWCSFHAPFPRPDAVPEGATGSWSWLPPTGISCTMPLTGGGSITVGPDVQLTVVLILALATAALAIASAAAVVVRRP